jgi:hypothetical protein
MTACDADGPVTKNAIPLVDFANHGRKGGLSVPEALLRPACADAADHHDHRGDDLRHLPLALALDEGGDPGAGWGGRSSAVDHADAADAGRRSGAHSYLVRARRPAKVDEGARPA